jgi:hypothetical protein
MELRNVNREMFLYGIALLLGIFLRFYHLGAVPLSEEEAKWAVQALQVANPALQSGDFTIGPQPGYVFLTGFLFTLFNSSDFLARFWPALAGSALIFLPFLFRRVLGPFTALIMAFGLAIDPGLIAVSRQAAGAMMALSFTLLAVGFWVNSRGKPSGALAGLASLSGPSLINGVISLTISSILSIYSWKRSAIQKENDGEPTASIDPPESLDGERSGLHPIAGQSPSRWFLLSAGIAVLIVGTYFLQYPQGLTAWFKTIPAYLGGWVIPSGIPAGRMLLALFVFEIFALIFGTAGIVRWVFNSIVDHKVDRNPLIPISIWIFAAMLILSLYPGRQVSDLVWVSVPLWAAASIELSRYIPDRKIHPASIILAGFVFILCALFWNALITSPQMLVLFGTAQIGIGLALSVGVFMIGTLTVILVSLGWSWVKARRGLVWGISSALLVYSISVGWGAAQLRSSRPQELWYPPPGVGQASLMRSTLEEISSGFTGFPQEIEILSTIQTPGMRWALRDFINARFVPILPIENLPPVIVTKIVDNIPSREASYRGQDFVWSTHAGWNSALPEDFISWFTFREAPLENEYLVLWVRSDLFPGKVEEPAEEDFNEIQ